MPTVSVYMIVTTLDVFIRVSSVYCIIGVCRSFCVKKNYISNISIRFSTLLSIIVSTSPFPNDLVLKFSVMSTKNGVKNNFKVMTSRLITV